MFATAHPSSLVNKMFVVSAIDEKHSAEKTERREKTLIARIEDVTRPSWRHSAWDLESANFPLALYAQRVTHVRLLADGVHVQKLGSLRTT